MPCPLGGTWPLFETWRLFLKKLVSFWLLIKRDHHWGFHSSIYGMNSCELCLGYLDGFQSTWTQALRIILAENGIVGTDVSLCSVLQWAPHGFCTFLFKAAFRCSMNLGSLFCCFTQSTSNGVLSKLPISYWSFCLTGVNLRTQSTFKSVDGILGCASTVTSKSKGKKIKK